jgi:hypothetical protein
MSPSAAARPVLDEALVSQVERAVRQAGFLPTTQLTSVKLNDKAKAELKRQLAARGLVVKPARVLVPFAEQVLALVSGGARVPLKELARRTGFAQTETPRLLAGLVREGKVVVVQRTRMEVVVSPGERRLGDQDIERLRTHLDHLRLTLQGVTKKKRAVLVEDVAALMTSLREIVEPAGAPPETRSAPAASFREMVSPPPAAAASASSTDGHWEMIEAEIRALEDPRLPLVFIPDLMRRLEGRLGRDEIHRLLLAQADAGRIELRHEGGIGRLSPEELALCPPGPRGTVLSNLRRLTEVR